MYHVLTASRPPTLPERLEIQHAVGFSWCWPDDGRLEDRLASLDCQPPPAHPPPGAALLVSVLPGQRRALWQLVSRPPTRAGWVPFRGTAAETLALACRLAVRHAPVLYRPPSLPDAPRWSARFILKEGEGVDETLDDRSFGLAMALGAVSGLLESALPPDLVALAAIQGDGALEPVGQLKEKLGLIADAALGVRRVLVAHAQARAAKEVSASLARPLEVLACDHVAEALEHAFPQQGAAVVARWTDPSRIELTTQELFKLAVQGSSEVLRWAGVESVARAVAQRLDEARRSHERLGLQANVALRITQRHCGRAATIPWPSESWLLRLPRPIRIQVIAHVVQSHGDSDLGPAEVNPVLERAQQHLPPEGEEHAEDLRLLGALGRALSRLRAHDEALPLLDRAVRGWFSCWRIRDSSHALCEHLRVAAVLHRDDDARGALSTWLRPALQHPEVDRASRSFLRLAAGRALVLLDDPESALVVLGEGALPADTGALAATPRAGAARQPRPYAEPEPEPEPEEGFAADSCGEAAAVSCWEVAADSCWEVAPDHVRESRWRWQARALEALGRREAAAEVRRRLSHPRDGEAPLPDFHLLARLDLLNAQGADPTAVLEALERSPLARFLIRHVRQHEPRSDWGQRVADEYPY